MDMLEILFCMIQIKRRKTVNNEILLGIFAFVIGYFAGSISFSRLVTRLVSPDTDLEGTTVPVEGSDEEVGMNAISATSVRFQLGPRYGLLASFLDMVKVAVPVGLFIFSFLTRQLNFLRQLGAL